MEVDLRIRNERGQIRITEERSKEVSRQNIENKRGQIEWINKNENEEIRGYENKRIEIEWLVIIEIG